MGENEKIDLYMYFTVGTTEHFTSKWGGGGRGAYSDLRWGLL